MTLCDTFYRACIVPAWDLVRRTRIAPALRDLERTQWLSPSELRALQERRLRRMMLIRTPAFHTTGGCSTSWASRRRALRRLPRKLRRVDSRA